MEPDYRQTALDHAAQAEELLGRIEAGGLALSEHQALATRAHVHAELASFYLTAHLDQQAETKPDPIGWTDD